MGHKRTLHGAAFDEDRDRPVLQFRRRLWSRGFLIVVVPSRSMHAHDCRLCSGRRCIAQLAETVVDYPYGSKEEGTENAEGHRHSGPETRRILEEP